MVVLFLKKSATLKRETFHKLNCENNMHTEKKCEEYK